MKPSNSEDVFGLSNNVIKKVAHVILDPMVYLINLIFEANIFPHIFKITKTIPVYKKGDRNCPSNYRPISIVPVLSKIVESCIKVQLFDHLAKNEIINGSQFGFRPGLSPTKAIESLVSE